MPDYKFTTTRDDEKFETGLFNSDGKTDVIASTPVVAEGKGKVKSASAQTATTATNTATDPVKSNTLRRAKTDIALLNRPEVDLQNQIDELNTLKTELTRLKGTLEQEFNDTTKNSKELQEKYNESIKEHSNKTYELFQKEVSAIKDNSDELIVKKLNEINKRTIETLKEKDKEIKNLQEDVKNLWEEIAKLKGRIPLKIFDCESKSIDSKSDAKQTPITIFDCENKKDPQLIKIFDCKSDAAVADAKDVNVDVSDSVDSSDRSSNIVSGASIKSSIDRSDSSKNVVASPKTINAFTCDSNDPKTINAFTCANDNKETSDYELYSIIFLRVDHHYVSANLVKDTNGNKTWRITNSLKNAPNHNYIDDMPSKEVLFTTMNTKNYIPVAAFYTNKGLKEKEDNGKIYNNDKNACYMVSVLQTLYHSNAFQDLLSTVTEYDAEKIIANLRLNMNNIETDETKKNISNYVENKWKNNDTDKKYVILSLIKKLQTFIFTEQDLEKLDKFKYKLHLMILAYIIQTDYKEKTTETNIEQFNYGNMRSIFEFLKLLSDYVADKILFTETINTNLSRGKIEFNMSDKEMQIFQLPPIPAEESNKLKPDNIPDSLSKDEQTKDGNITAFACAEPKITAFDCEEKVETPTDQPPAIPSASNESITQHGTAAVVDRKAAANPVIKPENTEDKPVIKAFECAKEKPVIKAFECAATTSDIKPETAEDKPVIKAFECEKEKPVIKAFECAEDKPVIKAFECAKDETSIEDIKLEDEEKNDLIEKIVNKVSGVKRVDRLEQIRKLIGPMNPRYITKEDTSVRQSNKTPLFFDLKHKENFRENKNNGETSFLTLYNTKKEEHSKIPMTKHDNNYRLRNHIVNNMKSMNLNEMEKKQVKTKKDGSIVLDNEGKTIPLYSYDYLMKHKLRANKIDNLIYVSKEDIREQLNYFSSQQLTFLNKYLENGKIEPIELIEDAKRYNVDKKTDDDNLKAWVENKINKINVNQDAKLFAQIEKLVLTMFACEPTLEEEIKKLHDDIKALKYTTGNDEAKSKAAAEAAAKKLKELRKEYTDAYDKLIARLKSEANKKNKELQEKLEKKRKALENNADELETIEQDLIEFQIENTSDTSKLEHLVKIIKKKYLKSITNLETASDVEQRQRKNALTLRLQELNNKANAKLRQLLYDGSSNSSPLNTPAGSRANTAANDKDTTKYTDAHRNTLQNLRDEEYLRKEAARKKLKEQIDAIRNKLEKSIQEANNDENKIENAKTEAENEYKIIIDELKSEINKINVKYQQAQVKVMTNSQNFSNSPEAITLKNNEKSINEDLTFVDQILKEHVEKNEKLDAMKENFKEANDMNQFSKDINKKIPLTVSKALKIKHNQKKKIFKEQQTRIGKGEEPTEEDKKRGTEHKKAMKNASELSKTLGNTATFQKFEGVLKEELENKQNSGKRKLHEKLNEKRSQSSHGSRNKQLLVDNFMDPNNSESKSSSESESPRNMNSYHSPEI